MQVNFYATLRAVVGGKSAEFALPAGSTVWDVIHAMIERYPGLGPELLDDQGRLYQHVHIFIQGRDAVHLDRGLDTPLAADETLGVFPAVGGG